ncbi:hypothetical protein OIHEL45_18991, partial [Sulfitobacter indolifex HEL-45]
MIQITTQAPFFAYSLMLSRSSELLLIERSYEMKRKNRVYVPGMVAAFSVAATSAIAQVAEIPSRSSFY